MNAACRQVNASLARFPSVRVTSVMPVSISVHESVFPETVRRGLVEGLRARAVPPRYHYDSARQARRWLAVQEAHSPARHDPAFQRVYDESFQSAARLAAGQRIHVIGLGCGAGRKEAGLLGSLEADSEGLVYSPCDVSLTLVLAARRAALAAVPGVICQPLLCDVALADDLPAVLSDYGMLRVVTFFGLIPNLEPHEAFPKLRALVRPGDLLLLSANLAPGTDYAAGVRAVMPGYENAETRLWLGALLEDNGVEPADGTLAFSIEQTGAGFLRIVADYQFQRERAAVVDGERIAFAPGESLRLFFSYRYTPEKLVGLLADHGLEVVGQWITPSGEEGVFQCRARPGS